MDGRLGEAYARQIALKQERLARREQVATLDAERKAIQQERTAMETERKALIETRKLPSSNKQKLSATASRNRPKRRSSLGARENWMRMDMNIQIGHALDSSEIYGPGSGRALGSRMYVGV